MNNKLNECIKSLVIFYSLFFQRKSTKGAKERKQRRKEVYNDCSQCDFRNSMLVELSWSGIKKAVNS